MTHEFDLLGEFHEHPEIQDRLGTYMDSFHPEDAAITKFDPVLYMAYVQDILTSKDTDLFVCERLARCLCRNKTRCNCDSDDCEQVSKLQLHAGSNCNYVLECYLKNDVEFNPKRILRLFTLDKKTDVERPVVDITKTHITFLHDRHVSFETRDKPKVKHSSIFVVFDYMSFSE